MTPRQLQICTGCTAARATMWLEHIERAMDVFNIAGPNRITAFLAQIGHESGGLAHTREIWGPTQVPEQVTYERDFTQAWGPGLPKGHRNRKAFGLGNSERGDGFNFRGRGLIQTTGRANYRRARDGLRKILEGVPDFEARPEHLEHPEWAARSAGLFWFENGLNAIADQGTEASFLAITKKINGGTNGLKHRQQLWDAARAELGTGHG